MRITAPVALAALLASPTLALGVDPAPEAAFTFAWPTGLTATVEFRPAVEKTGKPRFESGLHSG